MAEKTDQGHSSFTKNLVGGDMGIALIEHDTEPRENGISQRSSLRQTFAK